jgi:hypothetical protein
MVEETKDAKLARTKSGYNINRSSLNPKSKVFI